MFVTDGREHPGELVGPAPDGTLGFIHVDMDAFYASVEVLRRPELRGRPVVVGGTGRRGVVAAASYEARAFGVRSAMPSVQARRLCPDAVFLVPEMSLYIDVSERIMAILRDVTPLVEPLSLDEAFCDVRGVLHAEGPAPALARRVRERILEAEGLTCSVGVATSKFVAKLATSRAKPEATPTGAVCSDGVYVVEAGSELDFLHPLPIRALWGVGPATQRRLAKVGVETVGDLAALSSDQAAAAVGDAVGRHLHRLANAIDDRPVHTGREAQSIGHEQTFAQDMHDRTSVQRAATRLADSVARRMRDAGVAARTITVKVRFGDFTTITRSTTKVSPIGGWRDIAHTAHGLLDQIDPARGVRLLGVSASNLAAQAQAAPTEAAPAQPGPLHAGPAQGEPAQMSLGLLTESTPQEDVADAAMDAVDAGSVGTWKHAERAMDEIRDRFGSASIAPAAQISTPDSQGLGGGDRGWGEVGENPWGPDAAGATGAQRSSRSGSPGGGGQPPKRPNRGGEKSDKRRRPLDSGAS